MAAQEAQTKGLLHQYLLQHHLQRALWAHGQAVAFVSAQAVRQLRSLLGSVVRPVLVAAKDAPLLREPTSEEVQGGFPLRRTAVGSGQYAVVSKTPFGSGGVLIPGLRMELVRGIKARSEDPTTHCFLAWRYQGGGDTEDAEAERAALVSSMARLAQQLTPLQRDVRAVVRIAEGVGFSGESGGALSGLLLEWDDRWQPLRAVIDKHGAFFRTGRLETFRLLATRLLDTLVELGDRGVVLRALSPSAVVVDETGTCVRVLLLPTAYDVDRQYAASAARGDAGRGAVANEEVLQAYMEDCQDDPILRACLPHGGRFNTPADLSRAQGVQWDAWSFGATLFALAFGRAPAVAVEDDQSCQGV